MNQAESATQDQVEWFADLYTKLVAHISSFIRGKDEVVRAAALCMISEGHLLIEDVPGTGKTMLAKTMAAAIDGTIRRIQFTPDLLPMDCTGGLIYRPSREEFEFQPGPVFTNILIADEVNRASPKTQSALLEVMEERQVTVDGTPFPVPRPFIVIATENPIELSGTYPLPEAQRDRFMMHRAMGYPSLGAERQILEDRARGLTPEQLSPIMTAADLVQMITVARGVYLSPAVLDYIVSLADATRRLPEVRLGVSPRGSLALSVIAQTHAAANRQTYVTADNVKALVQAVFAHRLILEPDAELRGVTAGKLVASLLAALPVPQQRFGV